MVLALHWSGVSVWLDRWREGGGRTGHHTLLPAVSSLTLHFLPTHTLAGTAAITAQWLREHNIGLISLTNQPIHQPCSLHSWLLSLIWTEWGSPDLELCDCELNIQEFPSQLLLPASPFKHNVQQGHHFNLTGTDVTRLLVFEYRLTELIEEIKLY